MEINEYRDSTNKKGGWGRNFSPKYSSDGEGNKIEKRGEVQTDKNDNQN